MNIIVRAIINRPKIILLSFLFLFVIAVLMTGLLRFEQDIFKSFPQHDRAFRVLIHSLQTSTAQDRLYILIKGPKEIQGLIESGKNISAMLQDVHIKGRPAFRKVSMQKTEAFGAQEFKQLLISYLEKPEAFLTEEDRIKLQTFFASQDELENELKRSIAIFAMPGSSRLSQIVSYDPLNFRRFLIEKLEMMHQGLRFAPGPYLISLDETALLLIATPTEAIRSPSGARLFLRKIDELRTAHPHLEIGLTGGYALEAQQTAMVRRDILHCVVGSALAIAILFVLVYRNLIVLSFVLLPLGVGIQLTLGVMSLAFDSVHIIALAFSAVVLGLGIDFAIHVYDRYIMERHAGKGVEVAVHRAVFRTGAAVLIGGITTLTAFFVLNFTKSPLLKQIGWLVPLGLMFCMVTILWALPALLVLLDRHRRRWIQHSFRLLGMNRLGKWVSRRPQFVFVISFVLFIAALPGLFQIGFEGDPMALRPKGLEAISVQQDMLKAFGADQEYMLIAWKGEDIHSLWNQGRSLDKALQKFHQKGLIASWVSISRISSPEPFHIKDTDPVMIQRLFRRYGLELGDFQYTLQFLRNVSQRDSEQVPSMETHASTSDTVPSCQKLETYPEILKRFFICDKGGIEGIAWVQLSQNGAEPMLREYLSESFQDLVLINPRLAVKGLLGEVSSGLRITISCAGILVLLILTLFFRRIQAVLLVMLPMVMGILTTVGIMGWFGIHLNLFNFIVIPILIGIGLDDGIHIFRRHEEFGHVDKTLATTGRSVFLTTLTTACGFGSLALAQYHVLKGMGFMAIIGVMACFLFSVLTLPAILRMWKETGELS